MSSRLDPHGPDRDDGCHIRAATQQRIHPSKKNHGAEGLRHVVVYPKFKGIRLVVLAVLCGQHQDRRLHPVLSQSLDHVVTVHAWEHEVKKDEVESAGTCLLVALIAVIDSSCIEAATRQTLAEGLGQPDFVVDNQNAGALGAHVITVL
jgi:hypothetical protein